MILKTEENFDNSKELQKALDSFDHVVLEEGIYYTGPLVIRKSVVFELKKGAVLKFIPDFSLYAPFFTRWEGVMCYSMHPCLLVDGAENVKITGEGVIDGSGKPWWDAVEERRDDKNGPQTDIEKQFALLNPDYKNQEGGGGGRRIQFLRPPLVQIKDSKRVTLSNLSLKDSPFWTVHPLFSTDILIDGIKIVNPYLAPNTDGIDIDSCKNVLVSNCFVSVGDDGICIKSGSGRDGIAVGFKTENIKVTNCTVEKAHGGAVIGSETAAGIDNVLVEGCTFNNTDRGIRIKSRRGRGGKLSNLTFRNIKMEDNLAPFVINLYYRCGYKDGSVFSLSSKPVNDETPSVENVTLENCISFNSLASAGMIVGLPESPVMNIVLKNCYFSVKRNSGVSVDETDMYLGLPEIESRGLRIRNARVKCEDVEISCGNDDGLLTEEGVEFFE